MPKLLNLVCWPNQTSMEKGKDKSKHVQDWTFGAPCEPHIGKWHHGGSMERRKETWFPLWGQISTAIRQIIVQILSNRMFGFTGRFWHENQSLEKIDRSVWFSWKSACRLLPTKSKPEPVEAHGASSMICQNIINHLDTETQACLLSPL